MDSSISDFDVNVLDDGLEKPNIHLTFPLPTDKDTYVSLHDNEKLSTNFRFLNSFVSYMTGSNFDEIYSNNEYRYAINRHTAKFNQKLKHHMDEQLKHKDKYLDELVYGLIDQELKLKLIQGKDFSKRFKQVKDFMVKYYQQENAKNTPVFTSHNFVRVCYITVMSIFQKMFPKGLWVNRAQLSKMYQQYLDDPMSIIFLPNHQSHLDYMILHVICVRFQIAIPTVIAGENLNVAVFGKFMRQLGAIYIKRSFNHELYTERNLANLLEFIFLNKIHFEVFIEGTRSRDGKLLLPKFGILKMLCNIYLKQREVEKNPDFDMLFQPISITYERIYEADGYLSELVGSDKQQESMTNILKNGISNLVKGNDKNEWDNFPRTKEDRKGKYDNSTRNLHGRIFVKLGEAFKLSKFIDEDKKTSTSIISPKPSNLESTVNLKRLGFKILHEINKVSFLPEISILGTALQAYYNCYQKPVFPIADTLPVLRLVVDVLERESAFDEVGTNVKLLKFFKNASDATIINLFKKQVPQFFRFIKINFDEDLVVMENSMELLYYKNLTIHLIIQKCLVCFLVEAVNETDSSALDYGHIHKLYYIFTGFLKNEFLFDYDYNKRNELSNILQDLVDTGVLDKSGDNKFTVVKQDFVAVFAEVVKPFVEAYMNCIDMLSTKIQKYKQEVTEPVTEQMLVNDALISKNYPTTKSLLRDIQATHKTQKHVELINKQYLILCLFYLNSLQLIKIFKNNAKTKAYVTILNTRDLSFILRFLNSLMLDKNKFFLDSINMNYAVDIIDKTFERSLVPKL